MKGEILVDAVKNLDKAEVAANKALQPYGFRLDLGDKNINVDTGIMYIKCILTFGL